jgi:hypothetical protein
MIVEIDQKQMMNIPHTYTHTITSLSFFAFNDDDDEQRSYNRFQRFSFLVLFSLCIIEAIKQKRKKKQEEEG